MDYQSGAEPPHSKGSADPRAPDHYRVKDGKSDLANALSKPLEIWHKISISCRLVYSEPQSVWCNYFLRFKTLNRAIMSKSTASEMKLFDDLEDFPVGNDSAVLKRDTSGAHLGWYWGNFIPQIPHQMMTRYTKEGDWVLDAFVGSGTTLIECRKLGRNGIGIELNRDIAQRATELIEQEPNQRNVITDVIVGDSKTISFQETLHKFGIKQVQLLIMHPPYDDIISFSENADDLSNCKSTEEFLAMFSQVVENATPFLEKGRSFVLVIGDKYAKGEWIPLGFYCMQEVLKRGYLLKSIIVKNFDETRAKREQKELWRYRALVGGFYIFKHEYIFVFQKH